MNKIIHYDFSKFAWKSLNKKPTLFWEEASRKGEFIIYMHENFFIDECGDELKKKLMEEGFNVSKSLSQVVRNSPYNWSISW